MGRKGKRGFQKVIVDKSRQARAACQELSRFATCQIRVNISYLQNNLVPLGPLHPF